MQGLIIDWKGAKYKSVKINVPNHLTDNFEVKAWDGRHWVLLLATTRLGDALELFRLMFQPMVFIKSENEEVS